MVKPTISIVDAHQRLCELLAAHEPPPSREVMGVMQRLTSIPQRMIFESTPNYRSDCLAARMFAER